MGSTVEASKVRKNRKIFAFKKFILTHCLDSATPPRPNERDPNKKKQVREHRFFRGDPCAMTFHESNMNGVH